MLTTRPHPSTRGTANRKRPDDLQNATIRSCPGLGGGPYSAVSWQSSSGISSAEGNEYEQDYFSGPCCCGDCPARLGNQCHAVLWVPSFQVFHWLSYRQGSVANDWRDCSHGGRLIWHAAWHETTEPVNTPPNHPAASIVGAAQAFMQKMIETRFRRYGRDDSPGVLKCRRRGQPLHSPRHQRRIRSR
jgi:hypothetical protein